MLDPRGKRVKGAANKALVRSIYPNGITKGEAEVLLTDDVRRFSVGVEQLLEVTVSDAKFCALLSFTFNVGVGALRCSTLLRLINRGDFCSRCIPVSSVDQGGWYVKFLYLH